MITSKKVWRDITPLYPDYPKITITTGNLLDRTDSIILHQVNCMGVMGAGLAKQVRVKYPEVYEKYKNLCDRYSPTRHPDIDEEDRKNLLGVVQICKTKKDNNRIVNIFGQYKYGKENYQYTNTTAVKSAFVKINREFKDEEIFLPYKLGCGHGNASWEKDILPLIKTELKDVKKINIIYLPPESNSKMVPTKCKWRD